MSNFKKNYTIRINDLDRYDRLKPSAILDISQDLASKHADSLHVGYDDLIKKDLARMVVRTKFKIYKDTNNIELVKGETFPLKYRFVEQPREYILKDVNEEIIAKGESIWIVLDLKSKKMDVPDFKIYEDLDTSVFNERVKKLNKIERNEENLSRKIEVTSSLIDHNGHLNNSHALDFFLDSVNLKENERISSFQIEYLSQAFLGDILSIYIYRNSDIISCFAYKENELKFYMEVKVNEY